MVKETYTVDKKEHSFELGKTSKDAKGNLQSQEIVIDGQKMTIVVEPTYDNYNKSGAGLNVGLKIVPNEKNKKKDELGYTTYTGPDKEVIMGILQQRVLNGKASRLEQIAVYQRVYNQRATAEHNAKDADTRLLSLGPRLLQLTREQIEGKEQLPAQKKRFPWAYADETMNKQDRIKAQKGDEAAKYRRECRKQLKEGRWASSCFSHISHSGVVYDQFAYAEETKLVDDREYAFATQVDSRKKASAAKEKDVSLQASKDYDGRA